MFTAFEFVFVVLDEQCVYFLSSLFFLIEYINSLFLFLIIIDDKVHVVARGTLRQDVLPGHLPPHQPDLGPHLVVQAPPVPVRVTTAQRIATCNQPLLYNREHTNTLFNFRK